MKDIQDVIDPIEYVPQTFEEKVAYADWADRTIEPLINGLSDSQQYEIHELLDKSGVRDVNPVNNIREAFKAIITHTDETTGQQYYYEPYSAYAGNAMQITMANHIKVRDTASMNRLRSEVFARAYPVVGGFLTDLVNDIATEHGAKSPAGESMGVADLEVALHDGNKFREMAKAELKEFTELATSGVMETDTLDLNNKLMRISILTMLSGKRSMYSQVANKLAGIRNSQAELLGIDPKTSDAVSDYLSGTNANDPELVARLHSIMRATASTIPLVFRASLLEETSMLIAKQQEHAEHYAELTQNLLLTLFKANQDSEHTIDLRVLTAKTLLKYFNITPVDFSGWAAEQDGQNVAPGGIELEAMELDWEVLPPGQLEENAREIVNDAVSRSNKPPTIDLSRLKTLELIRDMWGADACFYSRGRLKKRSVVRAEDGTEQADQYIVLVLQEHDASGTVTHEHAVAESPIAGHNAMYVYRQDVGEESGASSWRSVMSLSKAEAQDHGARAVPHAESGDLSMQTSMLQKAEHLLTCPPTEFKDIRFNGVARDGTVRVRLLGNRTLKAAS